MVWMSIDSPRLTRIALRLTRLAWIALGPPRLAWLRLTRLACNDLGWHILIVGYARVSFAG